MDMIVVDDERLALEDLMEKLKTINTNGTIKGFQYPNRALEEVKNGFKPQVAFLDIEMYGLNGIELAIQFKNLLPSINIIFVTGFTHYATDAFALHASGYITKPVRVERIKTELDNLRNPVPIRSARIRVQTFGNFEVFVDGKPLKFKRSRTKELLAYLVDLRGTGCTAAELASILWEDRSYDRSVQNQLQVHISDLIRTLKHAKASGMIVRTRNNIAVNVERFECDVYRLLDGDMAALNAFAGKYMASYSWAEITSGLLYEKKAESKSYV